MTNRFSKESSHLFNGTIWNMVADADSPRLFLEVRDVNEKKTTFSALNVQNNTWVWKDLSLEEPWWVSLSAVAGERLLVTIYADASNPDKKSLVALDIPSGDMVWWQNGFSVSAANRLCVKGIDARFPLREVTLDAFSGALAQDVEFHLDDSQNFPVIRPFQYEEGTAHFETVGNFLRARLGLSPVATLDYLEWGPLIIMSVFIRGGSDLANFLYVFDSGGELLHTEQLGENLKGVGLDTFFIYSDHLIFVRNKNELKTYKII